MKTYITILIGIISINHLLAQTFYKNTTNRALTFKELKTQFNNFKKSTDLSKQKYWKSYKRWEQEMELHTNAKGEPAGFDEYVNATIAMSNYKQQMTQANASASWSPFGPNVLPNNLTGYMENGIGRINCITFHPTNANTFFVGVAQGGVWKTTNNGVSWTPLTDNLPITRISDITINPTNPNEMYISVCDFEYIGFSLHLNGRKRNTHYGLGVYKTTDGGLTWNPTGLTYNLTNGDASLIRKVLINPANTNDLVACGVSGMYKSTNGGTTWVKKLDSLFWDMHQDPSNPAVLYASTGWVMTSNIGNAGVYKSTDFGNTWIMLATNMPLTNNIQRVKLAIAPSNNNYIYALCVDVNGGLFGIYKSIDAGLSWTFIPPNDNILEGGTGGNTGGQGNYDLGFIVDFTDPNKVYTGGVNLWGSIDGANTFNPISHWTTQYGATLHGDIHFINRNPFTGNYFVCSDGGVYQTTNMVIDTWSTTAWPTVWTKMNDNIQISSLYKLSSSKTTTEQVVAGAQDNASMYFNAGNWSTIFGGDGMDNCLNPLSPTDIIGSSQYGNFYYSNDNGNSSFAPFTNVNSEQAEWVTPIIADYNNAGVMYIGNENVVKSTDGGQSWSPLATIFTNSITLQNTEISALAVSSSNSQVLYAARRVRYENGLNGIVFKTTDGGTTFTNVTNNLPDSLYYTSIEINETNENIVYVSMAGFTATNKVFTTINGGTTWQNISYNLPNLPVNCIKQIPGTNHLMVATDIGIYILYSGTTTWINNSFGLPNVIVTDIEFNAALNKVYISTFGRGIWESTISSITGTKELSPTMYNYSLYPTVNNGTFNLEFNDSQNEKTIEVIDVMGKIICTQKTSTDKLKLSLNLSSGIYYIRTHCKNTLGVKKMIVE
jgi:photosystem II stability/assembly factor-like uncharacterized protein